MKNDAVFNRFQAWKIGSDEED